MDEVELLKEWENNFDKLLVEIENCFDYDISLQRFYEGGDLKFNKVISRREAINVLNNQGNTVIISEVAKNILRCDEGARNELVFLLNQVRQQFNQLKTFVSLGRRVVKVKKPFTDIDIIGKGVGVEVVDDMSGLDEKGDGRVVFEPTSHSKNT